MDTGTSYLDSALSLPFIGLSAGPFGGNLFPSSPFHDYKKSAAVLSRQAHPHLKASCQSHLPPLYTRGPLLCCCNAVQRNPCLERVRSGPAAALQAASGRAARPRSCPPASRCGRSEALQLRCGRAAEHIEDLDDVKSARMRHHIAQRLLDRGQDLQYHIHSSGPRVCLRRQV